MRTNLSRRTNLLQKNVMVVHCSHLGQCILTNEGRSYNTTREITEKGPDAQMTHQISAVFDERPLIAHLLLREHFT
jgi:hypothetical protein